MKKFVTLAAVAAFAFAGSASAATTQSQIDALLAQIAALQGGATVSTGATFTYQGGLIRVGSRGQQVRDLQTCLAAKGINASSNIDGIFGSKTAAAVRTFQAQNGVAVDGIIGPVTGPLYTQACSGSTVVVETEEETTSTPSVSRFDTTGGEEADLTDLDVNDADDDSISEGEEEADLAEIEFELEEGGAALLERLDVILNFSGADDGDETDAWDVFNTIYVMVDGDVIAEVDADDEDDYEDRDTALFAGDDNRLRISGIDHVFEAEEDHTIVIAADIAGSVDLGGDDESEWTLTVDDLALRFIDEAGITIYLSEEDGGGEQTAEFTIEEEGDEDELTVRESDNDPEATALEVEDDEKSDWFNIFTFEVEVDEDSEDLEFNNILVTVETGTANVGDVVDDFELRIGSDVYDDFDYVSGEFGTCAGATTAPATADEATCVADSGTYTPSTIAVIDFDVEDDELTIDADDELDIELWVEFNAANGSNYAQGETVTARVTSANVDAWDVEGGEDLDEDQLQGAAQGETHTLLEDGAVVTFDGVEEEALDTSDELPNDRVSVTFDVMVEAFDETVYVPVVGADAFLADIVNAATNDSIAGTDTDPVVAIDTITLNSSAEEIEGADGNEYYEISSEETFSVRLTHNPADDAGTMDVDEAVGDFYAELSGLNFTSDDVTEAGFTFTPTVIVLDEDEFQSGTVTLTN